MRISIPSRRGSSHASRKLANPEMQEKDHRSILQYSPSRVRPIFDSITMSPNFLYGLESHICAVGLLVGLLIQNPGPPVQSLTRVYRRLGPCSGVNSFVVRRKTLHSNCPRNLFGALLHLHLHSPVSASRYREHHPFGDRDRPVHHLHHTDRNCRRPTNLEYGGNRKCSLRSGRHCEHNVLWHQ